MEIYLKASFIGTDGDHGYTNGETYEIKVYCAEWTITIQEALDGTEWEFKDLPTFLSSWSYVSME
jgi:hypothetical protein